MTPELQPPLPMKDTTPLGRELTTFYKKKPRVWGKGGDSQGELITEGPGHRAP